MRGWLVPLLLAARRRALAERRRGRAAGYVGYSLLAGALGAASLAMIVTFGWLLVAAGVAWLAAIYVGLILLVFFPWAFARAIAVPMGWPRIAYRLAAMAPEARGDSTGVALIAAAWALARQRTPSPADADWIEVRRDRAGRLGDARVVATALVRAARGDRDGARDLMESVALLPELTPLAREVAADWLAADDAERGRWDRILARAPRRGHGQLVVDAAELGLPDEIEQVRRDARRGELVWPATPTSFLLEGIAARLTGAPGAPGDLALLVRWLEAPRRRHTWGLVRLATAAGRAVDAPPPSARAAGTAAVVSADPVGAAVGWHVAALDAHARGRLDAAHVIGAAAAWDRALGCDETRTEVLRRALDLGAPPDSGHRILDELARTAADDLAALIVAADLPIAAVRGAGAAASPTLEAALGRVRHRLLAELELAIARTSERVSRRRDLPAIDEWRELLALRAAHRRAIRIGGDEVRRLAFPHLHEELTPWLVRLWNDRDEHTLSDALTCWLLAEALAVGDAQAIEVHAKNASLPLPPRASQRA